MRPLFVSALLAAFAASSLAAQGQDEVIRERREFTSWLLTSGVSPRAAVAQQAIGGGLTIGPRDADIPLTGVARHDVVVEPGRVVVRGPLLTRTLGRGALATLGAYKLLLQGAGDRPVLTIFGAPREHEPPEWFAYDSTQRLEVRLTPPEAAGKVPVTGADGVETLATEAGTVALPDGARLRVRRFDTGRDESELEIYFRDKTNGDATYPAGRFVTLEPLGRARYRLDFNRARNPFCAYNTVFPCPAPWPGNQLTGPVAAGEKYTTTSTKP